MPRWLVRLAVAVAAAVCVVAPSGTAWAAATIPVNPAHQGAAATFGSKECAGPVADLAPDRDGWHFVLPRGGTDLMSLTLTFRTRAGTTTAVIGSTSPDRPSGGPGWSGFLTPAGAGQDEHAYLVTDAGWLLRSGSARVRPDSARGMVDLRHTCPGTPAIGRPIPSPAAPSPAAPSSVPVWGVGPLVVPSGGAGTGGGGSQGPGGVALSVGALALAGAAGAGLVVVRRRRDGV
jgi:hypothetical protein